MFAMQPFLRFIIARRARGAAIVALAAVLASTVPVATYRCNYGMVEAGPMCPFCHGDAQAAVAGESAIDRGPCCSSEILDASPALRDPARDYTGMHGSDGWLSGPIASTFLGPTVDSRALPRPHTGRFAPARTPFILRL
jgi:hypothetical protein